MSGFAFEVIASTCAGVTTAASSASANPGTLPSVSQRSLARFASLNVDRVQSAMLFSGNGTCGASACDNRASAAASHDLICDDARIADSIAAGSAVASPLTDDTSRTRSTTAPNSIRTS